MVTVNEILKNKQNQAIHTIGGDETVLEALKKMAAANIGALIVVDARNSIVGIFSERDYARKIVLLGRHSAQTQVSEIMSPDVITTEPDELVSGCMEIMTSERVRHLPVLKNGKLVGVISIGDVVKAIIEEQAGTIRHLEDYISGAPY